MLRQGSAKFFRRLRLLALGLLAFYALWLTVSIAGYKKWGDGRPADVSSSPFHEIRGVYHVHTKFSDGMADLGKVARVAKSLGLDFIVVSDHGSPNRRSLAAEAWSSGVLCLTGSELATSRGHLVALGFTPPEGRFPQNAELAARAVAGRGGFSVIAHPFNKTLWSWGEWAGYSGLEIIDADTMIKKNAVPTLPYLPSLLLRPGLYLLKILDPPSRTLRKWDGLNEAHRVAGYFSADAHFLYRSAFSLFRLHVLLEKPLSAEFLTAKEQVFNALRTGSFYNSIEAAASASGFRYWAQKGGTSYPMGSEFSARDIGLAARAGAPLSLRVDAPYPFAIELRFIYNGKMIFSTRSRESSLIPLQPGAYRVEVFLREKTPLRPDIPWIISNPIFIQKDGP